MKISVLMPLWYLANIKRLNSKGLILNRKGAAVI